MRFINTVAARLQNVIFAAGEDVSLGDRASNMWHAAHDEEGQTLVEYALIISVIALGVIGALIFLRDKITGLFSDAGNSL